MSLIRPIYPVAVFALIAVLALPGAAEAQAEVAASAIPEEALNALEWREVGPYRGGRSAAVAGLADDPETYYFGATGGGVWKTVDAGVSWENVSDGYFGGSIGAVAVSEWDPNVVYVGGGEKTVRGNVSHGDGIWKSNDAGKTWQHMGLGDSRRIPRIRIHPKDPDRVYVAALGHLFGPNSERGVYRSVDGGESWEQILFVSDEVGCVDLVMDPTNPRVLYASFWRVKRTPWSLESGGEGSGLWKSTDGGDSWVELTGNPGLPAPPVGIIGITVSRSEPDNLYAIFEAEDGGVFRSRDGGETWAQTNAERKLRQRAWYYTRIEADPVDPEVVYVMNVRFHRSKDGGKTFNAIPTPHGDNHDLWIDPRDPMRMIEANDGGANVSFDGGRTWSTQANQPTAQMYRVSVDDDYPYRLLGGQQDNSAVRIRSRGSRGAITTRDWEPTAGGESGHIVAKPGDPDIVYGGSYGGFLVRVDHGSGERRAVNVWPDNPMGWGAADLDVRFQWNFPLFFSPHDADTLYAAGNRLYRSRDEGASWQPISPDLTRDDKATQGASGGPITKDNTGVEYYATIFAAVESPLERGVLWAASDDGLIHLSRDGGESWRPVTPPGLPEWMLWNSIEAHPFEPGGLYAAGTRYKSDDFEPYLYRTTDWGRTWTEITRGIEEDHFTRVVRADPERQGLLYAGTERGVYLSLDDGASWRSMQGNLPIVPVTDLAVKDGDLVVATQGRGYWILDDLSPLAQMSTEAVSEPFHLFTPRPTVRAHLGRRDDPGAQGTNPPGGVIFTYWLAEVPAEDVPLNLEILDGDGEVIRSYERKPALGSEGGEERGAGEDLRRLPAESGTNRFAWDLSYPPASRFPGMILWNDDMDGPIAVPGEYQAVLHLGESSQTVTFAVVADPRSSASQEDLEAQFDFVLTARDKLTEIHDAIADVRDLEAQIDALLERLGEGEDTAAVREKAESILDSMKAAEEALYQTKNQSRQDPLNFPIRLNDKLAGVKGLASMGAFAPTAQAVEVYGALAAEADGHLKELARVRSEEVAELNRLASEASVPALILGE